MHNTERSKNMTQVPCRCLQCERTRMGNQDYFPRFYLKHHEFIETTISINENQQNTTEMKFSIYGDPMPLERNALDHQYYSIEEVQYWKHSLIDLIEGHMFVPFSSNQDLNIDIYYHLKTTDRWLPVEALNSLTDDLLQAMTGIFFDDLSQVQEAFSYKEASFNDEGSIRITMRNVIAID